MDLILPKIKTKINNGPKMQFPAKYRKCVNLHLQTHEDDIFHQVKDAFTISSREKIITCTCTSFRHWMVFLTSGRHSNQTVLSLTNSFMGSFTQLMAHYPKNSILCLISSIHKRLLKHWAVLALKRHHGMPLLCRHYILYYERTTPS